MTRQSTAPAATLACLAAPGDRGRYRAWAASCGPLLRVVTVPTDQPNMDERLTAAVGTVPAPYAVFAAGSQVPHALAGQYHHPAGFPLLRIVIAGAAPIVVQAADVAVPLSVLAATGDAVTPDDAAGWRRLYPRGFGLRVIEAGPDFLDNRYPEVLAMVAEEIGATAPDIPAEHR
jgi:hypothetical protein